MGHKHLTQEQIDEMNSRFEAGESKLDIAKVMNLAHDTVVRNTPKVLRKTGLTEDLKRKMIQLVEAGKTKSGVARSLGISRSTVYQYTGHIRRATTKITPEIIAAGTQRALAGDSSSSIARDLQISRTSALVIVRQALRDYEPSDLQKAAILAAREDGKTVKQIASNLGIPLAIVNKTLGIDTTNRHPDGLREAVIRAIESGETATAAARRLGAPLNMASAWFNAAVTKGMARRPEKPPVKGDDFQFTWITRQHPSLEEWRKLIVGWFEAEKPASSIAMLAVTAFIDRYLIAANLPTNPADLLQRGRVLPGFYETACPKSNAGHQYNARIYELIEWVLDSPDFADIDGAEPIRITDLYRNPINLNASTDNTVRVNTESTKVVLPYFLIADLRKRIVQGPSFRDWTWVQRLTGYETINGQAKAGDWFPVSEDRIDFNDLDCVWRLRKRVNSKPVLEMWSPVRWVHALFHLQTTTRSGQARMVDSGEADTFIWKDDRFLPNPHSLRQGTTRKPRQQGIFRQPSPENAAQGATISLHFNTNKTADRYKAGTAKGFECPWPQMPNIEEDPYYWLAKLRDWQMRYNPIDRLTPWRELKGQAKLSVKTEHRASEYPDTAFLFRAAENADHPAWPIKSDVCHKAWQKLLTSYETTLAEQGIKHPSGEPIELINPENGSAWSSPHATRTSLITHLIIDGDVPPVVMMKIAGHARFVMTIYYTKVGLASIQNAIKAGTEKLEATKYQTFERDLLGAKAEQIRNRVVFNAEDWRTVLPVNPADRNPLGWMHMHDGICLAGGNTGGDQSAPGCHNGGPTTIAATSIAKARHGPVAGGVRNCSRCRWKAAGKQHLLGLAATYDNRAYHLHKAKDDAIAAERECNRLMQDKARVESTNEPYTRMRNLIDAERRHEIVMQKFQEMALDIAALHRTIERVMALPENTNGPTALAAQGDLLTVTMIVEDTDSELLQLAVVCADVELYPDLEPGTAIFEFAKLLDHAFEREGQPMVLARLSEKEKLAAANAIMRELERKANPHNPILGRRHVVAIMDRDESLESLLGVRLKDIAQLAAPNKKQTSLRLMKPEVEEDHDNRRAS